MSSQAVNSAPRKYSANRWRSSPWDWRRISPSRTEMNSGGTVASKASTSCVTCARRSLWCSANSSTSPDFCCGTRLDACAAQKASVTRLDPIRWRKFPVFRGSGVRGFNGCLRQIRRTAYSPVSAGELRETRRSEFDPENVRNKITLRVLIFVEAPAGFAA